MVTNRMHGFSLIEIVVSGALIATTLGALFAVSSQVRKLDEVHSDRVVASGFAREGIEIVRSLRDAQAARQTCEGGVCDDWRVGLIASSGITPQRAVEKLPLAKPIVATEHGYELGDSVVFTHERPCTDFLTINEKGSVVVSEQEPVTNKSVWCRRLLLEPVSLTSGEESTDSMRVRSQVAWKTSPQQSWTVMGSLQPENPCSSHSTTSEWCLEYVTYLTDWKSL
ncbi:MAG TPA: hypothetical protein VGE59_00900 [Patescibacteria group bacterium]